MRISIIAALCILSAGVAAGELTLVSVAGSGHPGEQAAGRRVVPVPDALVPRPALPTDSGDVFFVTLARLSAGDTNAYLDAYRWSDGVTTQTTDGEPLLSSDVIVNLPSRSGADTCQFIALAGTGTDPIGNPVLHQPHWRTGDSLAVLTPRQDIYDAVLAPDAPFAAITVFGKAEDSPERWGILLHDLVNDTRTDIAPAAVNGAYTPDISADAQVLVFSSDDDLSGSDNNFLRDIYRYDRVADTYQVVSIRAGDTNQGIEGAFTPAISADGTVIAFSSSDPAFVDGDTNGTRDIFIVSDGVTTRVPHRQPNADATAPRLSEDGRFVAFLSAATNLDDTVDTGITQAWIYDRTNRLLTCASRNAAGAPANQPCEGIALSVNGRYATFLTAATNLAPDLTGVRQAYRFDLGVGYRNLRPNVDPLRLAPPPDTADVAIALTVSDPDDDIVTLWLEAAPDHGALTTRTGDAIASETAYPLSSLPWTYRGDGTTADTFAVTAFDGALSSDPASVCILYASPTTGYLERTSITADGTQGSASLVAYTNNPGIAISADSQSLAFASPAAEFGTRAANDLAADIFSRSAAQSGLELVTTGFADTKSANRCRFAGDGRTIVYYTQDGNRLIRQSIPDGERLLVAALQSAPGSSAAVSHDGSRVACEDSGTIFLYQIDGETVTPTVIGAGSRPALSADGRVLAYEAGANVICYDIDTAQVYHTQTNASRPTLSSTARYLGVLAADWSFVIHDLSNGSAKTVATDAAVPALSADGRTAYFTADDGGVFQAYRWVRDTDTATIISHTPDGQPGDGDCYAGAIAANGRRIHFTSDATDLVANDTNTSRDAFLADFGDAFPLPVTAPDQSLTIVQGQSSTIALAPPESDPRDLVITRHAPPVHGTLSAWDHRIAVAHPTTTVVYTAPPAYLGSDSFQYTLSDGVTTATGTITIEVTRPDLPPEIRLTGSLVIMDGDAQGQITADLVTIVDPDGEAPLPDDITITIESLPAAGILSDADGPLAIDDTIAYTALPLTYTVADAPARYTVTLSATGPDWTAPPATLTIVTGARLQTLNLRSGWQLIAFALDPGTDAVDQLFPARDSAPPVFWSWQNGRYERQTTVTAKHGYWVYNDSDQPPTDVSGTAPDPPAVSLAAGWNLIGPTAVTTLPDALRHGAWAYDRNRRRYRHLLPPQQLQPGAGYWLYVPADTPLPPD